MKMKSLRFGLLILVVGLGGVCFSVNSIAAQDVFNNNTRGGTGNAGEYGGPSPGPGWQYVSIPSDQCRNCGNLIYTWCKLNKPGANPWLICQKPQNTYQEGGLIFQKHGNGTSYYNGYPNNGPLKGKASENVNRNKQDQNNGSGYPAPVYGSNPNSGNNRRSPVKGGTNKTSPRQKPPQPYYPPTTPGQRASKPKPPLRGNANTNLPVPRNLPAPGKRADQNSKYRLKFTYLNNPISGPSAEVFPDKRNDKAFYVADVTNDSNIDTVYYQMMYSPMNKNKAWARIYQVRSRINGQLIQFEKTVELVRQ